MSGQPSRVEEYIGHAATLRLQAANTSYPEVRARLLGLAPSFERLAHEVDKWENERLLGAAH